MATVREQAHELTIGAGYRRLTVQLGRFEQISSWFVVTGDAVIVAVLLVSASSAALYVGTMLSEVAGTGGAIARIECDAHRETDQFIDPTCGPTRPLNHSLGQ